MTYEEIPSVNDRTIMFLLRHWEGHNLNKLQRKLIEKYGETYIYEFENLIENEMASRGYITYENVPSRYEAGNATIRTTIRGTNAIRSGILKSELLDEEKTILYSRLKLFGEILLIVSALLTIYEFIIKNIIN